MEVQSHIISNKELQLEYVTFGEGPIVICLHGHSRSYKDFLFLNDKGVKAVCIHLFFHEQSTFPIDRIEDSPLNFNEFLYLFNLVLAEQHVNQFHLFAFSQGGRFALKMIEHLPKQINSLTLLAPDGLNNASFYNWSSRQKWARSLFVRYEEDPRKFFDIVKRLGNMKMVRPKAIEFVNNFTSNKEVFLRASRTWRAFRTILPQPKTIGKRIHENNIDFLIIMGKYDQVIRPKQAHIFCKNAGIKDVVIEIDCGHEFFNQKAINNYIDLLPFLKL